MLTQQIIFLLSAYTASSLKAHHKVISAHTQEEPASGYYWPSGHGPIGSYGFSKFKGPKNLKSSLSWTWHHPGGRYHTIVYGTAIDDQKNIYVTTDTSMWKLDSKGKTLWSFAPGATIFSSASLLDGRVHFTTLDGKFWAIDMETGTQLWSKKVCDKINQDNGYVTASEGVVVAATDKSDQNPRQANGIVHAVNATNGNSLWTYRPSMPTWNFMASMPGDGTVLYQDFEGSAYCHNLFDGKLLWAEGGEPDSWTDGTPLLADGVYYTVSAFMERPPLAKAWLPPPGFLHAFRLKDGMSLWKAAVPMPPNNAPAFGKLPGHTGFSVVQPGGYQGVMGGPTGVWAFDAATGQLQWSFQGPAQKKPDQAGNREGIVERIINGASASYVTNPWSAATMDVEGTVYLGHEDGLVFALRDSNGDGVIQGEDEVNTIDTGAAFVGSSSPAHAPGMLALASCDTLFVFSTD